MVKFIHLIYLIRYWICNCAVFGGERGLSTHSSCVKHERRWQTKDNVRPHFHQRYWSPFRQHCLQESWCRHEQEVSISLFISHYFLSISFIASNNILQSMLFESYYTSIFIFLKFEFLALKRWTSLMHIFLIMQIMLC